MEEKKGISKRVWIVILSIIFGVGLIIAGAGAIYYGGTQDVEYEELSGGEVSLTYTDEENIFSITQAVPMSDEAGKLQDGADKYFDFTVSTDINNANNIEYSIILLKDETMSTTLNENIRIYLERQSSGAYEEAFGPGVFVSNIRDEEYHGDAMTILKVKNKKTTKDNYRLRMWVADGAAITPEEIQNYSVKIIVKGKAS